MEPVTINIPTYTPLTANDLSRVPGGTTSAVTEQADVYQSEEPKKSKTWLKALVGVAAAALAIVGIKHAGKESFLKIANPEQMTFTDKIKNCVLKTADAIEWPFVKIKNMFSKTADDAQKAGSDVVPGAEKKAGEAANAAAEGAEKKAGEAANAAAEGAEKKAGEAANAAAEAPKAETPAETPKQETPKKPEETKA